MPADFTIVEGDTAPVLTDTLTTADDRPAPLEGATIELILRSFTSPKPLTLTGAVAVTDIETGEVSYTFAAADSLQHAGMYVGSWRVTFADGTPMTFPTVGFLWVSIQPSLATPGGQQLVGLPEVKEHLNIDAADRGHDAKLMRVIRGIRPLIESAVGPVALQTFEEWFDGGNDIIGLTHTPNRGFGTSPVLTLMAASEYRANIEYPLDIVASPVFGSMYSMFLNERLGTITRRVAGGGVIPFYPGRESIHVFYQAGQEHVPDNVIEAALEAVRVNYRSTQPTGKGRQSMADGDTGPALGYFLPKSVHERLSPNRRYPSIA